MKRITINELVRKEGDNPVFEKVQGWFFTEAEYQKIRAKLTVCPTCRSENKLVDKSIIKTAKEDRVKMIIDLYQSGFTIREIATQVGYKSPRSVQIVIEKQNKIIRRT